jgi:hypothetical protein
MMAAFDEVGVTMWEASVEVENSQQAPSEVAEDVDLER